MEKIKNFFKFFFGFQGRIGRVHWTVAFVFIIILNFVAMVFSFVPSTIISNSVRMGNIFSAQVFFAIAILLLLQAFVFLIKYSHIVRRVHDFDKKANESSRWAIILLADIFFIFSAFSYSENMFVIRLFTVVVILIIMLSLCFTKGTQGENRFGSGPVAFGRKK